MRIFMFLLILLMGLRSFTEAARTEGEVTRSKRTPPVLNILFLLTALPAYCGGAAGAGGPDFPKPLFEEAIIPNCDAIIYGWAETGELVLSLEDTVVFLADWQLLPSLLPDIAVEASSATMSMHETEVQAWALQWELQNQDLPVDEIKQRILEFFRQSPLVDSIEHIEGKRYKLQRADKPQPTILHIADELSRNPAVPPPDKPVEERRRMARARFERWKAQLSDGNLVLFTHERTECYAPDEKDLARAEINAIRAKGGEPVSERTWGIEHLLSASMAAQIQTPHSLSRKGRR